MHYFKHGLPVSRREAFEADGKTLRDGVSVRVRMSATDSAPDGRSFWDQHRAELLIVDPRRVGGVEGNRPGFRVSDSPINRQAVLDAYQQYEAELTSAYRNPPRDAEKKEDPPPVTGRSRCPECDGKGVVHGRYCQGCGGDGWVDDKDDDDNGKRPQLDPASDRRSVDQIAADHAAAMERVYAARNREISDAWREGKVTNG